MESGEVDFDFSGIKASFGVDPEATTALTYRELRERREVIRSRLAGRKVL